MKILAEDRVKLNANAKSKEEAITLCGDLLVQTGCVTTNYVKGMLAREEIMSTYLGNGVAIPHGQFENRADILKTGLSVLQVPAGIEWEPGEMAYLIVGIAAFKDEHVSVLVNLAEVIDDQDTANELIHTDDVNVILDILNKESKES